MVANNTNVANTKEKPIVTALAKLLNVKSLVTIALTVGFIVQSVRGLLTNEYSSVYLVVISFYFGTQYQKNAKEGTENGSKT